MHQLYTKPQRGTKAQLIICVFCASLWLTTAAYKVHYLDPIVVVQHRLAPLTTTRHFAIDFDRDSRGRHIKLAD
jgi:hypothetical protein